MAPDDILDHVAVSSLNVVRRSPWRPMSCRILLPSLDCSQEISMASDGMLDSAAGLDVGYVDNV